MRARQGMTGDNSAGTIGCIRVHTTLMTASSFWLRLLERPFFSAPLRPRVLPRSLSRHHSRSHATNEGARPAVLSSGQVFPGLPGLVFEEAAYQEQLSVPPAPPPRGIPAALWTWHMGRVSWSTVPVTPAETRPDLWEAMTCQTTNVIVVHSFSFQRQRNNQLLTKLCGHKDCSLISIWILP